MDGGLLHTRARRTSGRLFCWGGDGDGQVGNGPGTSSGAPVQVSGNHTDWRSISAGAAHTCGRRAGNRLLCWGRDLESQLGNGPVTADVLTPLQLPSTTWTAVSAGGYHTCARTTSGRLYCWGNDASGQVGDGAPGVEVQSSSQVAGAATDRRSVHGGAFTTCATTTTGRAYCWGRDNPGGGLGDDTALLNKFRPSEVFA